MQTIQVDMDRMLALGAKPLRLLQVEGPGEGQTLFIVPLQELIFGRDAPCDVSLDDKLVSRQHARIEFTEEKPELLDLGSVNGTFLNGEKVARAPIKVGDQLQIGLSTFEVRSTRTELGEMADLSREKLEGLERALQSGPDGPARRSAFAGQLTEIELVSVLQTLGSNGCTGNLVVRRGREDGALWLDRGQLTHVKWGQVSGPKAFYRLVALQTGSFELFTPGRKPDGESMDGNLEGYLLEAARQLDELTLYTDKLPKNGARLSFNPQVTVTLAKLPPEVLQVVSAIASYGEMGVVFDRCALPDLSVCRILLMLLNKRVVQIEAAS